MNTSYEIVVKIRTPIGLIDVGSYLLGKDLEFALSAFDNLKGESNDNHDAIIRLFLIEKNEKASPKQLKSIGCILDEFAENSKFIARDVFKFLSLEK